MNIKIKDGTPFELVEGMLIEAFDNSRFTLDIKPSSGRRGAGLVKLLNVRLKSLKGYCGNHAKACERHHTGPHKKTRFLEGADWVEFNDLVNDTLDANSIEADVVSAVCILRKGRQRRTDYDAERFIGLPGNGEWVWDRDAPDDHYVDNCGGGPMVSTFPEGTPGIHVGAQYDTVG